MACPSILRYIIPENKTAGKAGIPANFVDLSGFLKFERSGGEFLDDRAYFTLYHILHRRLPARETALGEKRGEPPGGEGKSGCIAEKSML